MPRRNLPEQEEQEEQEVWVLLLNLSASEFPDEGAWSA